MNNWDELQNLWQQNTEKPRQDAAELVRIIRQQRRWEVLRMTGGTLTLAATFVFILFILFHYPFAYFSTYAGCVLVLLSIVAAVLMNSRMLTLLHRSPVKEDTDNKTMLANMRQYQERQRFFQTTFISAYYLTLTAGLMLYMYELTHTDHVFMLIAYSITLGWIAFSWWYLRPRTICKQTARINAIIVHLESLEQELGEDSTNAIDDRG